MLKLDGISSFVAIAEDGSISAAARRLNLSKSVVSERLAELEHGLGAQLFHRTTRKLSLTEDGAAFLERAVRIVREVDDAAAEVSERRGKLTGPAPRCFVWKPTPTVSAGQEPHLVLVDGEAAFLSRRWA